MRLTSSLETDWDPTLLTGDRAAGEGVGGEEGGARGEEEAQPDCPGQGQG